MVKNAFPPLHKLHVKFSPNPNGYYDGFYTTYVRTVDSNGTVWTVPFMLLDMKK